MRYLSIGLVAMCVQGTVAHAQQTAHTHGVGTLQIAIEEGHIEMELIISGADIVGFEHEPTTDADKQAVRQASKTLADTPRLFAFAEDAGCRTETVEIESGLIDDNKKSPKDDHDHNHDHSDAEHAEFHVHYVLRCSNPGALSHVDVLLFEHFPATTALDVHAITQKGQTSADLTAASHRFTF